MKQFSCYFQKHQFTLLIILLLLCIVMAISSCVPTNTQYLIVEQDQAKSTTRVKHNFYHRRAEESYSPLQTLSQVIIKETSPTAGISYKAYDRLTLGLNSYPLEDTVYILIHDKVFPIVIESLEIEKSTKLAAETQTIRTHDSTYLSVVTGYNQYYRKHFNMVYSIPLECINPLRNATEVRFRYYSGPNMMTVKYSPTHLVQLKSILNSQGNVLIEEG